MTGYVIRSMSTTDYRPAGYGRPEQRPEPYHLYLAKPEHRGRAWWRRGFDPEILIYATEAEAQVDLERLFKDKLDQPQIAPLNPPAGYPNFWDR